MGSLKRHERIHNSIKAYKCGTWQTQFKRTCNLKNHDNIHTGDKLDACIKPNVVCVVTFCNHNHRNNIEVLDFKGTGPG